MMRPPPPRVRKPATSDEAPAREDAPPPIGKTYEAPPWGGPPSAEFHVDVVKGGAVVGRVRLDATTTSSGDVERRGHVTFGRHPSCDVVVEHPSTSRLHCVIQFKAGETEAYVFDCGSAHGTFVNRRRVKPGVHAPVRVGDQIKLGESSRAYVLDGDESLMPEEGLSAAEMKALAALERAAEEEAKRELEKLKAERAAKAAEDAANKAGSSWGMVDADEEIAERQRAFEELDWRTHDGKFSDKQEKQKDNIRRREEKIANMRSEIDRIRAKESQQEGGLTAGQTTRLSAIERAIDQLEEEIEDADETLNESLRVSLGLQGGASKRRKRHHKHSDDDDEGGSGDEDDFYDRSSACGKRRKDSQKPGGGHSSAPKTIETATTLWDKRIALEASIAETEELISVTEEAARAERQRTSGLSNDGDELDAYMDEIGASKFTAQVDKLRVTLEGKVSELERVSRLLRLADPTEEFRPGSTKGDAMRKHAEEAEAKRAEEAKRCAELAEAKRAEELEARQKRDVEAKRQAEWEEQGNLQEKRKFTGGGDAAPAASARDRRDAAEDEDGPVVVEEAELTRAREPSRVPDPPSPNRAPSSPPSREPTTEAPVRDDDNDDGFLMPDQVRAGGLEIRKRPAAVPMTRPPSSRRTSEFNDDDAKAKASTEDTVMSDIQRLIDASSGARRLSDDDEADDRDIEWAAPAGQSGDGTSALNKKLGY